MNTCALCKASEARAACSKCKTVYYCSRECQSSDWKRHKPECQQMNKKKYFLKSSWNNTEVICGYGCYCQNCMASVVPFKVFLSYQSGNVKQEEYLAKMIKTACEEIKDIKFEFVVVDRSRKAPDPQVEACDVLFADYSATESFVSDGTIPSVFGFGPDPIVVNESECAQCCVYNVYNAARGMGHLPGLEDSLIQFRADKNTLEQCTENRQLIRDLQTALVDFVIDGFRNLFATLAHLSPSLVFGLVCIVNHPSFDDKKFPYIVIKASLSSKSYSNIMDFRFSIQTTHFCRYDHFPMDITQPCVVVDKETENSPTIYVTLRLSTQMIKYYWSEATEYMDLVKPVHFYAVHRSKDKNKNSDGNSSSRENVRMSDENVLFLFPKTGNEDFEMPGMGGCVRRYGFTQVPIF